MEKFSHSKIDMFIHCPWKYKLRHIDHIKSKTKSKALALGSCIASALRGFRSENTLDAAMNAFMETWKAEGSILALSKEDDPMRSVPRGLEIVEAYVKEYPDEPEHIIQPEINFEEEIAPGIIFRGRIDGVISTSNGIGIIEDKTASRLGDYFFVEKGNSYQFKWYLYIADLLGLFDLYKTSPRGIINAIYIHPEKFRFQREPALKMKRDVQEAGKDLLAWIYHIQKCTENNSFPKADYDICSKYGGCEYALLRRASGEIFDRTLEANYVISQTE
jgi:hypothetical protein